MNRSEYLITTMETFSQYDELSNIQQRTGGEHFFNLAHTIYNSDLIVNEKILEDCFDKLIQARTLFLDSFQ